MTLDQCRQCVARLLVPAATLLLPAHGIAGGTTAFLPASVILYQTGNTPGALIPIPAPQHALDSTCPEPSFVFISFFASDGIGGVSGHDLYSSVLSAMLAGHKVSFGVSGCDADTNSYPLVYAVTIY